MWPYATQRTRTVTQTIRAMVAATIMIVCTVTGMRAQMVTGHNMTDFDKVFRLTRNAPAAYRAEIVKSAIPGNILWPGEKLTITIKVENRTDSPIASAGRLEIIGYGTQGKPGDVWVPTVIGIGRPVAMPVTVQIAPKSAEMLTVHPDMPARFGGYALVLDLGPQYGRQFVLSCVRTFRPDATRVQYPALSLDDNVGREALARLGVHAIRWGLSYKPTTDPDFERWYKEQGEQLKAFQDSGITVLAMAGGGDFGGPAQPLHHERPWLDDKAQMLDTKFDIAWLPSFDADFKKFVTRFCADYGWPKGLSPLFPSGTSPGKGSRSPAGARTCSAIATCTPVWPTACMKRSAPQARTFWWGAATPPPMRWTSCSPTERTDFCPISTS